MWYSLSIHTPVDPHSCKAWAKYWLIILINKIFTFQDPLSWTFTWLLESNDWRCNEDRNDRPIIGRPLNDRPQSRPLLRRHFELKSDNLSICNVKFLWSLIAQSLHWNDHQNFHFEDLLPLSPIYLLLPLRRKKMVSATKENLDLDQILPSVFNRVTDNLASVFLSAVHFNGNSNSGLWPSNY